MRLITISEYQRLGFEGKPPCANTIKRWIERGIVAGEKRGGLYFVHVGEPEPIENDLLRAMVQG